MNNNIASGKIGEERAADELLSQGYKIIQRNFRCKFGEIDLIAKDKDCLCFIEVKSRTNFDFGLPEEAINKLKKKHLIKSAQYFLSTTREKYATARFDVVSVMPGGKIEVIKDAFYIE